MGYCRPGDGQQLPLALGEILPVSGEHGIIAVRQTADKGVGVCQDSGLTHLLVRGLQTAKADVVSNGPGKEVRLLHHHRQGTAEIRLADAAQVQPVIGNGPALDLIKPGDQIDDGSLSRSGGAHKGDLLPRLCIEAHIPQHCLSRHIAKGHMIKPHVPPQGHQCLPLPAGTFQA